MSELAVAGGGQPPWSPLTFGRLEWAGVETWGVLLALAFLASLALSARLARVRDVPRHAVAEWHVAAVPLALVASRLPALLSSAEAVLASPAGFADVVAAPAAPLPVVLALAAGCSVVAWITRQPLLRLADCVAPGAAVMAATVLSRPLLQSPETGAAAVAWILGGVMLTLVLAFVAAARAGRLAPLEGEGTLVACIAGTAGLLLSRLARLGLGPAVEGAQVLGPAALLALALALYLRVRLRSRGAPAMMPARSTSEAAGERPSP